MTARAGSEATGSARTGPALVDLSMNELPYPPLPSVRRLVEEGAARLNRYPDHSAAAVIAALASRLDVPAERVMVGPGSAALCQHLVQALRPRGGHVMHPALSFEAYPLIIANGGARPVPVPMDGPRPDLDAMAKAVDADTRAVLLCNPNNPTGAALGHDELIRFLDRIPSDVVVIVDEAYREFVTDPVVADGLELHRDGGNVCVLRTFSKAYGLAALRIGYGVAPPDIAAATRMVGMVSFPGSLGQAAAVASLEPAADHELARRCTRLAAARQRLHDELHAAGLPVEPSQANFVWLPVGERAAGFAEHCHGRGVLVRAYPGHGVRVTVGSDEDNALLCAAAREFA